MPSRIIAGAPASLNAPEHTVPLWVSFALEQDYRSLGAFPGLRIDAAKRVSGGHLFRVPIPFAKEVLEHGRDRLRELGNGRGVFQAYRAMVAKLAQALDDAEGVTDDPGPEAYEQEQARELARLREGEVVTKSDGEEGTVVRGLGWFRVNNEDGAYRDDGKRFDYRLGYVVQWGDAEKVHFSPPGTLYGRDGETTHLRLVRSN